MVTDLLGAILQEVARALKIPDLHPDGNHSCRIKLQDGMEVQIELDRGANFLVVGTELGEMPPGKFRENLFREALKANAMPPPINGTLAYSKATNQLVLFEKIPVRSATGELVASIIPLFVEKAKVWSEALKRGELPVITQAFTSDKHGSGMFGLKP